MTLAFAGTTKYAVREGLKVLMALLSLIGISGMYVCQVKRIGLLGLIGFVLFGLGYLSILATEVIGVVVLPTLTHSAPGYVSDVLSAANGGAATGNIGLIHALNLISGVTYLAGGFLFGIALFRAHVLARWGSTLLALGALSTVLLPVFPHVNERVLALPTGLALVGLGFSLWRERQTPAVVRTAVSAQLDAAGAK